MQAVRPRSFIAPLQIIDHYRSKYLIRTLHALGFCCSYDEMVRFEGNSALLSGTVGILNLKADHMLIIGDNIDQNVRTLDGKNTFHGMGMIAATIAYQNANSLLVPRKIALLKDIADFPAVSIHEHKHYKDLLHDIRFKIPGITFQDPFDLKTGILWKVSWNLSKKRPQGLE